MKTEQTLVSFTFRKLGTDANNKLATTTKTIFSANFNHTSFKKNIISDENLGCKALPGIIL